jgi:hypothetical protein
MYDYVRSDGYQTVKLQLTIGTISCLPLSFIVSASRFASLVTIWVSE